jgi:hypothetical protein
LAFSTSPLRSAYLPCSCACDFAFSYRKSSVGAADTSQHKLLKAAKAEGSLEYPPNCCIGGSTMVVSFGVKAVAIGSTAAAAVN